MSSDVGYSHDTVWRHLVAMGHRFLVNTWVPHTLSEENRTVRVRICNELLRMHKTNDFLHQLITVDEIWIYWNNVGHGGLNRSWTGRGDVPAQVPKQELV